ncbi:hypothetical protein [Puniceicoccus vermicola]|uniref:Uncharacterized protein n=1 Tax=Puniceicoccus vermicola TaxID=388746 RepID=A0A7X1AYG6_9BACT|nr:hypothetical protein [Puniceicoccus vermicola]MBC2602094.1 hypothetical protein [Puniceicoccus vermicola]
MNEDLETLRDELIQQIKSLTEDLQAVERVIRISSDDFTKASLPKTVSSYGPPPRLTPKPPPPPTTSSLPRVRVRNRTRITLKERIVMAIHRMDSEFTSTDIMNEISDYIDVDANRSNISSYLSELADEGTMIEKTKTGTGRIPSSFKKLGPTVSAG